MLRPAAGLRVHTTPAAPAFPCARPLTVRDPSSPASRHSHASVVVSSEEGLLYIFGGILDEPVVSSDEPQPGKVANDIWAYDMASQGWEEVPFEKSQLGCDLLRAPATRWCRGGQARSPAAATGTPTTAAPRRCSVHRVKWTAGGLLRGVLPAGMR